MNAKKLIIQEIEQVPEPLLEEVLDFLRFLKAKQLTDLETAILTETSLRKEWFSKEEDEVWQDL